MISEKDIDELTNKLSDMMLTTAREDLVVPDNMSNMTNFMIPMYTEAIKAFAANEACAKVLKKLLDFTKTDTMSMALTKVSEYDVAILEDFAENADSAVQIKLWQFLTLVIPEGNPNAYAYMMLAEHISDSNLDAGVKMYDFLLTIFPDHPLMLMSASECFFDSNQSEKAIKFLKHAKEICEKDPSNETVQELLPEIDTLLKTIADE
ncbi:MAG: hypothetical protein LBI37_00590 [Puniceicoccales bacterium]|jgi:tetratricopeptide (TPR) repeat protein|nr:hypothetical protein [Puniceicoccales bacterium]